MEVSTVSINQLIYRIQDEFEFNDSSWKSKAKRAIARGLDYIGSGIMVERVSEILTVENYKAEMPCDIKFLECIKYDGYFIGPINNSDNIDTSVVHPSASAYIDPGYIKTTFEEGEIVVYYKRIPVDDDGYPYIPNDEILKEALVWRAVYGLLLAGYKHHTISSYLEARAAWDQLKEEARIHAIFPTTWNMENFREWWLSPLTPPDVLPPNG